MARARLRRFLAAAAALAILACAFGLGVVTSGRLALIPVKIRAALARAQESRKPFVSAETKVQRDIETTWLRLRVESTTLPFTRPGSGGSFTSVGDDLLVLDHEGTVFAVHGTTAHKVHIDVPDNGYDGYVIAAKSPKYAALAHAFDTFRYNDVLFYEDAAGNGLVVSYTEWRAEQECYDTAVAHLALSRDVHTVDDIVAALEQKRAHWSNVFRSRPCLPLKTISRAIEGHTAGGRMAYRGGRKVLLGSGDYHWDGVYAPVAYAQSKDSDYGKIVEIDLARGSSRHVARGTRNVQGLMIDAAGRILATEHGPRGGDELNLIEENENYGWPDTTLGTRYNGLPWPSTHAYGHHEGFHAPLYAWLPSVGTSNLMQVRGFDPSWDGDYLVATLTARTLFHIRIEDQRVLFAEPIPVGERIRYARQHPDGRIVLWTDSHSLMFLSKDTTPSGSFLAGTVARMQLEESLAKRVNTALEHCAECHSFETGDDGTRAPALGLVFGRAVAASGFRFYSPALRGHGGTWDEQSLTRFLQNPSAFAPGTTMPAPGIEPQVIAPVVQALRELRNSRE